MAELKALTAMAGRAAEQIGSVTLSEVEGQALTLLAPFASQDAALDAALKVAFGMGLPKPGTQERQAAVQLRWFGHRQTLVIGAELPAELADMGLISDQSDAWCRLALQGAGAADVLARLVPVDLSEQGFAENATARSLCTHIAVSVTRTGAQSFEIMAFRSMAQSLWQELHHAAELVAARGRLA